MRLELSRFVEGDLDDIAAYIAHDNPHRAVTLIQDIRAKFLDIQRKPLIYPLRATLATRRAWQPLEAMPFSSASSVRSYG
ncbi:MAG: type II toxin-antitoxin system RelE/ParE family toxin [Candidatus Accumulibacter necessarius]|jgi:plasmid stabilization system protein ParE|uniref:type II toxin-antitoxin system RelE/ParE family toxin n=1 Tax=Candidatus Accumulibacter necessarius TaxID=2954386 RepID=UPI002FC2E8E0